MTFLPVRFENKFASKRRRLLRHGLTILALPLTAPMVGSAVLAAEGSRQAVRVKREFFGLHIHHLLVPYPDGGRTQWPFVPFGSWRIWNAYTAWIDLEPTPGNWSFSRLDLYVNLALKNQVEPILTLGRTPTWASARPSEKCGTTPGCAAEPRDLATWENYVTTVVSRYKGRIAAYEIWNEPAFSEVDPIYRKDGTPIQYFSGSAREMARLAESAFRTVKAVDSSALVVSPSVTAEGNGLRRLEAFLRAGGGRWCDVVGFHFYATPPEATYQLAVDLRNLLIKYGVGDKPIWNTEMGFAYERPDLGVAASRTNRLWSDPLSLQRGAAYLARSHIVMASAGIQRLHWFNWDGETPHPTMGLAASRGAGRTILTDAYQQLQRWLIGSQVGTCSRSGSIWRCPIQLSDGKKGELIWSTTEADVSLSSIGDKSIARIETLLSNATTNVSESSDIKLTEQPMLLVMS